MSDTLYDSVIQYILEEIRESLTHLSPSEISHAVSRILAADRIFIAGAGRSRLMMSAFAMRLMHMGLSVHMVGDVTTPAITDRDLLLAASGSGTTPTMIAVCEKARAAGAATGVFTANPQEKLGRTADFTVAIPTSYRRGSSSQRQIGASTFEEALLIFADALVVRISEELQITDNDSRLWKYHSNLE